VKPLRIAALKLSYFVQRIQQYETCPLTVGMARVFGRKHEIAIDTPRVLAALCLVLFVNSGQVFAAEPAPKPTEISKFSVLTLEPKKLPVLGLNDDLRIRLDGDVPISTPTLQLRIDGSLFGVEPRLMPGREIVFRLSRLEANRQTWTRLLGDPFGRGQIRNIPISVELNGKPLPNGVIEIAKTDEALESKISLLAYNSGLMILGIMASIATATIIFLACARTTAMRDSVIPQIRLVDRPYSLGRFQMAVWFTLILTSFLFIFAVTLDLNSITPESFVLLGMSGTTALAAVAVDQNKDSPMSRIQTNLVAMGIKTRDDVDRLYAAVQNGNGGQLASTVIQGANIGPNSASGMPANPTPTIDLMVKEYEAQVKDIVSSGFLKDLVNDINGPTIHRWQILIWTLVLGTIYLIRTYMNLETPSFGTNLLALMGIAGGV